WRRFARPKPLGCLMNPAPAPRPPRGAVPPPPGWPLGGALTSVARGRSASNNRTVQQQHWEGRPPRLHVAIYCAATWLGADRRNGGFIRGDGSTPFSCK